MNKIIVIISPFIMQQTVYVYDESSKELDSVKVTKESMKYVISDLAKQYDTNIIRFHGIKSFVDPYIEDFKQSDKYSQIFDIDYI